MSRHGYTYAVIRYMHDAISGECLNVGVVLSSADGRLEFRVPSSLVRIKSAFPDVNVNTIRHSLIELENRLSAMLLKTRDLGEALCMALPQDEGGLKASELGAGLTSNLKETADALLDRFVLRCDCDFERAQVVENKERRVAWHSLGRVLGHSASAELKVSHSSNDEIYQAATLHAFRV